MMEHRDGQSRLVLPHLNGRGMDAVPLPLIGQRDLAEVSRRAVAYASHCPTMQISDVSFFCWSETR